MNITLFDTESTPNEMNLSKRQLPERRAWMSEKMAKIGKWKVNRIAMPGTHHSGFITADRRTSFASIRENWAKCQDGDIFNQLNKGVRWFDFRVDKNEDGRMVFSHTIPSVDYVDDQLVVIKNYLLQYTKELVILHVEPDYEKPVYGELTTKINQVFGDMIVTKSQYEKWSVQKLVNNNKRVIITGQYASGTVSKGIPTLGSWYYTNDASWDKVASKGIEWLLNDSNNAITAAVPNSKITMLEGSVTPEWWSGTPRDSAAYLNIRLRQEIPKLSVRINVVSHDFADQELISTVIDYNDKFQ
jgi:hypothetical protein